MRDRHGVVDRGRRRAATTRMLRSSAKSVSSAAIRPDRVPVSRSACGVRPVQQRLVGDVEAHHRDRHAGPEHDVGGLGVGVDVELGRDGGVPLPDRAAHQAQVGDLRGEVRVEPQQQRDVGQRARSARSRPAPGCSREDAGRSASTARSGTRRRRSPARAACRRSRSRRGPRSPARPSRAARPAAPSATGTSSAAVGVEQPQGVLGAVGHVGVAADRGDGEQVELRAGRRRGRSPARRRARGRCR